MVILNIQGMSVDAKSKSAYKIEYLRQMVKSSKSYIPIIAITESWIKSYVSKAQLKIPNYNLHRSDRGYRECGGCLTYIHEDIGIGETLSFDNRYCEVAITPLESAKATIVNFYRPPKCPLAKFQQALNFVQDHLNTVGDSSTLLMSGDLNFPNINWDTLRIKSGLTADENSSANLLLSFLDKNGLGQFVDAPTLNNKNILVVFITNISEIVLDISVKETML